MWKQIWRDRERQGGTETEGQNYRKTQSTSELQIFFFRYIKTERQ